MCSFFDHFSTLDMVENKVKPLQNMLMKGFRPDREHGYSMETVATSSQLPENHDEVMDFNVVQQVLHKTSNTVKELEAFLQCTNINKADG